MQLIDLRVLLAASIFVCLQASMLHADGATETSTELTLEIKTIDLMLSEVEQLHLDESAAREKAKQISSDVFFRLMPLFAHDTIDNTNLWKLAARYGLIRMQLDDTYANVSTPMFHIVRLVPKYAEDEATLELVAKLNRHTDNKALAQAAYEYHAFLAPFNQDTTDPKMQYLIAENYADGKGLIFPNKKEAVLWYAKAAEVGHADAAARLGALLLEADGKLGVNPDTVRGIALIRQANDAGSAIGAYELGMAYAMGRGVSRDRAKAAELYKVALDRGHERPALFALIHGTSGDEAVSYAELAISKDYLAAYGVLGEWYLYGRNVEPNPSKAIELLKRGAEMGHEYSAVWLTAIYAIGYGVPKDPQAASKWKSTAIALGSSSSFLRFTKARLERLKEKTAGENTLDH